MFEGEIVPYKVYGLGSKAGPEVKLKLMLCKMQSVLLLKVTKND